VSSIVILVRFFVSCLLLYRLSHLANYVRVVIGSKSNFGLHKSNSHVQNYVNISCSTREDKRALHHSSVTQSKVKHSNSPPGAKGLS